MGQRPEGTFHKASSYLLQQLIHRSRESDAGGEEYGDDCEGEAESEESSESEMLNLEVCLAPAPCARPPRAPPQPSGRALVVPSLVPAPWRLAVQLQSVPLKVSTASYGESEPWLAFFLSFFVF